MLPGATLSRSTDRHTPSASPLGSRLSRLSLASSERLHTLAWVLSLGTIAWGALAFGAVYPWAYWPLAGACVLCGALGLHAARTDRLDAPDRALTIALAGVAGGILVQLIPLPADALAVLSPRSAGMLHDLKPAFAAGLVQWHPMSVWPADTITALALYAGLALLFIGMTRVFSRIGARRFVEALTVVGVLLALVGIIQKPLYTGSIYGLWELELGRLPFGPFVNRNHFAGWMVMALPLTLALLAAGIDRGMRGLKPGWRHKVLWFSSPEASQLILVAVAAIVMALSLMLTMSRSGITAFVLSLVMMGWFVVRAIESGRRRVAAAACLVLLMIVVVAWTGPDAIASRFSSGDWGEFNDRRGAWADAWSVARDFPLAGTGLNTYWAASLFYQRHDLSFFFAQAHNDYLQLAAEGGLLLVVPVLVCLALFAREVRRQLRHGRGSPEWWLRAGAVTGLTAIACQELVEFSLQMPGNAVLFATLAAIALHRPSPADDPADRERPARILRLVTPPDPHGRAPRTRI